MMNISDKLKTKIITQTAIILTCFLMWCIFNVFSKDTEIINIIAAFGSFLIVTFNNWFEK